VSFKSTFVIPVKTAMWELLQNKHIKTICFRVCIQLKTFQMEWLHKAWWYKFKLAFVRNTLLLYGKNTD